MYCIVHAAFVRIKLVMMIKVNRCSGASGQWDMLDHGAVSLTW